MEKNNFVFGDKHYLQIHGTAMGTRMAPSHANIFMAQLEQSLLARPSTPKPSVWWRYIDDIFAIWSHGIEAFKVFLNDLNEAHSTIKFTAEWSYSSISFLDTCVTLENGIISTSLHHKSTDTHQYLAAKSCHPRHCKAAIPYSQALRICRICSSDHDSRKNTNELHRHLVRHGYNPSFIRQQIDQASMINRNDALAPRVPSTNSYPSRVPLVVTFHPNLPKFPALTEKYLPLLHVSPRLKRVFPEKPITAFRRPKNLRDLLVSATLKPSNFTSAQGTFPCQNKRCLTCKHIKTGTTTLSSSGHTFRVRATATCKTNNVIYLIECQLCHKQYVGDTQNPLHIRLNGHRNDIKHKRLENQVAAHFCSSNHSLSHLTIMVVEQMHSKNDVLRKRRESFWIHQLQSLHPAGLNLDP